MTRMRRYCAAAEGWADVQSGDHVRITGVAVIDDSFVPKDTEGTVVCKTRGLLKLEGSPAVWHNRGNIRIEKLPG